MLVLDEAESIFVPVAFDGFDNTTKRRLRIPRSIIDQHGSLQNGESVLLAGDDRAFLEPFFSVREYGCYSVLQLIPLKHEETIYAVFLIAQPAEEDKEAAAEFPVIPPECGVDMFRWFASSLRTLPVPPYFSTKADAIKTLQLNLNTDRETGQSVLLCKFNVQALLEFIKPASEYADLYKLRDIVLRVLYSLVSPSGFYYETDAGEVILCLVGSAIGDCNFLTRHILLTLEDFFAPVSLQKSIIDMCKVIDFEEISASLDTFIA